MLRFYFVIIELCPKYASFICIGSGYANFVTCSIVINF